MSDCHFGVSPVNYPDPDPDPDQCLTCPSLMKFSHQSVEIITKTGVILTFAKSKKSTI